jgi:cold shock CspA family protein
VPDKILRYVAELESRFGRVTAGHVVVKAPGEHHRTGGLYEISIRLALPDHKEVNVGRIPSADVCHSDMILLYRIRSSARGASYRIGRAGCRTTSKHMRRSQRAGLRIWKATLAYWNPDGRDVYFHRNSVLNGDFAKLTLGTRVSFVEEIGEKGPQASTVRLALPAAGGARRAVSASAADPALKSQNRNPIRTKSWR